MVRGTLGQSARILHLQNWRRPFAVKVFVCGVCVFHRKETSTWIAAQIKDRTGRYPCAESGSGCRYGCPEPVILSNQRCHAPE